MFFEKELINRTIQSIKNAVKIPKLIVITITILILLSVCFTATFWKLKVVQTLAKAISSFGISSILDTLQWTSCNHSKSYIATLKGKTLGEEQGVICRTARSANSVWESYTDGNSLTGHFIPPTGFVVCSLLLARAIYKKVKYLLRMYNHDRVTYQGFLNKKAEMAENIQKMESTHSKRMSDMRTELENLKEQMETDISKADAKTENLTKQAWVIDQLLHEDMDKLRAGELLSELSALTKRLEDGGSAVECATQIIDHRQTSKTQDESIARLRKKLDAQKTSVTLLDD